jgi:hypothetical protein
MGLDLTLDAFSLSAPASCLEGNPTRPVAALCNMFCLHFYKGSELISGHVNMCLKARCESFPSDGWQISNMYSNTTKRFNKIWELVQALFEINFVAISSNFQMLILIAAWRIA